ncbi:MAG: acetyl-CoA carboxylase biotin carboxyl carrier protein, partial [Candidatus Omnitrophica bacterium]|nr:acetyl-CoA carboxylase biotin carboxyl carrier protein [Candidatus Omnitrophota bacterium]
LKIKLRRGSANGTAPGYFIERQNAPEAAITYTPALPAKEEPLKAAPVSDKNQALIKAPMVGTFYQSPSPEAAPFVQVGSDVEIGQVVCIIEAMKLMNEIKSEVKGKVKEILVENADPIEFGQVLFKIETA